MSHAASRTTNISTKGQVVLPKAVRDQLHWVPGTRLAVEATGDGVLLKAVGGFAPTRPEDVFACLATPGAAAKTIEEMEAGIAIEARRRHARGRY